MPPSYITHFKISKLHAVRDSELLFLDTPHSSLLPVIPPYWGTVDLAGDYIYLFISLFVLLWMNYSTTLSFTVTLICSYHKYNTPELKHLFTS